MRFHMYGALSRDGVIADMIALASQVNYNSFFSLYGGTAADVKPIPDARFDDVVRRINAVSRTDYADLIAVVEDFRQFSRAASANIAAGDYPANATPEANTTIVSLFNRLFAWLNRFEI